MKPALLAAIEKHDFPLDELARANCGTDLLELACRINSVTLAHPWIKAHPDSLTINRQGRLIIRRTQLEIPIRANSLPITRLMLDLGAIPGNAEVASATGEVRELLQTAVDALPWERRYD